MSMKYPVEGSCQFGKVTCKLHESPKKVPARRSTECQKLSTRPFTISAYAVMIDGDSQEAGT